MARCCEARSVRSPSTTSAPSRRRASARSSSRRTKARTLCPLASRNSVRLRPMPPTAPAAPVTRIGLSCLWFAVMSLTLGYAQKTNWIGEAKGRISKVLSPGPSFHFIVLSAGPSAPARGSQMTASRPRRSVDHLKPYQFKPGQSGNPKGGNRLQTLRAQLANLDEDVLDWLRRLFRRDRVSNTALDAVRLFLSLRYPEEWRAASAAPAPNQQPVTINAGTIPATP